MSENRIDKTGESNSSDNKKKNVRSLTEPDNTTPLDRAPKKTDDIRRQHNSELIRRMRSGETLKSFDSNASWYPPRPVIEKDPEAITRLYGDAENSQPEAVEEEEDGTQEAS